MVHCVSMGFDFQELMCAPSFPDFSEEARLAVAVSGGPDSLALARLLSQWSKEAGGPNLHLLTVDHGLREEAAEEAQRVGELTKDWPNVSHHILKWEGEKPQVRVQEEARKARYALMEEYCRERGIRYLFLGHHMDDQAETFLFRLAKGSGLDGLACMRALQECGDVQLVRPFLSVGKEELIQICEEAGLDYIRDPSNESHDYARVRLRTSMAVLAEEGLSAERLSVTTGRLARGAEALEYYADRAYEEALINKNSNRVVFNKFLLFEQPFDIVLRVVSRAIDTLGADTDYGPRMRKVEALVSDLLSSDPFRKRTLGGVMISRDDKAQEIVFEKEQV